MRNKSAKLGKLRNMKCEMAIYMNGQQTEDVKNQNTILVVYYVTPYYELLRPTMRQVASSMSSNTEYTI